MKKANQLFPCLAVLLICNISCSKEQKNTTTNLQHFQKLPIAKTSSVIGYWKDATTTVTSINNNPGYQKKILYSIGPLTVAAGDLVSVHLQQELTFAGSDNVMASCGVVVATSATAVDPNSSGYLGMAVKFAGQNLSSDEEISVEVLARSGSWKFTAAASNVYINAVFYGASTATVPDWTVPAGPYGELVAVLESGVAYYTDNTFSLPFSSTENKYYVPSSPVLNVQYSIQANIPDNSMVDCRFQSQATSEVPLGNYRQGFGRQVIQGTSATDVTGVGLNKQIQSGITKGEHHSTMSHVGGVHYSTGITGAYFNGLVYSSGWTGQPLYIDGPSSSSYGSFSLEVRPYVYFAQDVTRNISSLDGTQRVVYSVGPLDIAPGQVVEVRYQSAFAPTAGITVDSKIVRATSATSTSGVTVQPALARRFHPNYANHNIVHSTADKNTGATTLTGQYYNVVVWKISGAASCPVNDWGELEVVKR